MGANERGLPPYDLARGRAQFQAWRERRALGEGGRIISLSAVIKLGPSFRNANRVSELQWKRVRRQGELAGILKGHFDRPGLG